MPFKQTLLEEENVIVYLKQGLFNLGLMTHLLFLIRLHQLLMVKLIKSFFLISYIFAAVKNTDTNFTI